VSSNLRKSTVEALPREPEDVTRSRRVEISNYPIVFEFLSIGYDTGNGSIPPVQGISFVGSTSEVCCPHHLCNLQNLCPVPPYLTEVTAPTDD